MVVRVRRWPSLCLIKVFTVRITVFQSRINVSSLADASERSRIAGTPRAV